MGRCGEAYVLALVTRVGDQTCKKLARRATKLAVLQQYVTRGQELCVRLEHLTHTRVSQDIHIYLCIAHFPTLLRRRAVEL